MAILAEANPIFQRGMRIIYDVLRTNPCTVVTTFDHQYLDGLIVRLKIPNGYGMPEINNFQGAITVIDATTFTMDIDSRLFEPFTFPFDIAITDIVGNASGTLLSAIRQIGLGQTFTIGTQVFTVTARTGALTTDGPATGTMDMDTGAYTFTGADPVTFISWYPLSYPNNRQYAQVVPVGEINSTLLNATQNILPFPAE